MNFKQYLFELAQGRKELDAIAKRYGSDAKIGFEIECFAGPTCKLVGDESRDTVDISNIDDFSDLDEYFTLRGSDYRDFEKWVKNRRTSEEEDFRNDNPDASDEEVDEHLEEHEDYFSFQMYAEDEFGSVVEFCHTLEPIHGWASEETSETEVFIDEGADQLEDFHAEIAQSLKSVVGPVGLGDPATYDKWYITDDASIEPDDRGDWAGAEIISPPMKLHEALTNLQKVFKWMHEENLVTNETCGLHINVSVPNMQDIDMLKAAIFLGETQALKMFDRETNRNAQSHIAELQDGLAGSNELQWDKFSELVAMLRKTMSNAKYRTMNLRKLASGYIEVRVAGGKNYERDFEKIKTFILRVVSALDVASDPSAERELYMKKVFQLFSASTPKAGTTPDDDLISLLERAGLFSTSDRENTDVPAKFKDLPLRWLTPSRLYWSVLQPLHKWLRSTSKPEQQFTPRMKAQLKLLLKSIKMDLTVSDPAAEFDRVFGNTNPMLSDHSQSEIWDVLKTLEVFTKKVR